MRKKGFQSYEKSERKQGLKKKTFVSQQIIDVNIEEERETKSKGWNEKAKKKKVSLNVAGVKDVAINMT